MFHYISGKLAYAAPGICVVDAGGVGFKLTISQNTYDALPPRLTTQTPPEVKLFTYMAVREDGIELYGFISETELSSFKMLISVSGVGPKAAMSILSLLSPEKFALAVCTEDRKAISKASGIGPKTAARIILELKDKVSGIGTGGSEAVSISTGAVTENRDEKNDAIAGLVTLGFTRSEAAKAVERVYTADMDSAKIISAALKVL